MNDTLSLWNMGWVLDRWAMTSEHVEIQEAEQ